MIKLEVGKKYRTRGGRILIIESVDDDEAFPFKGVFGNGEYNTYKEDGSYWAVSESIADIVEEIEEPKMLADYYGETTIFDKAKDPISRLFEKHNLRSLKESIAMTNQGTPEEIKLQQEATRNSGVFFVDKKNHGVFAGDLIAGEEYEYKAVDGEFCIIHYCGVHPYDKDKSMIVFKGGLGTVHDYETGDLRNNIIRHVKPKHKKDVWIALWGGDEDDYMTVHHTKREAQEAMGGFEKSIITAVVPVTIEFEEGEGLE